MPLDRPPFPLPAGVNVPIYFTVQPGLAQLETQSGGWSNAWLVYPNLNNWPVGSLFNFWDYDADNSGWYVYGKGKVAAGGKQIDPNPGVGFYEFSGAMVGVPQRPQKPIARPALPVVILSTVQRASSSTMSEISAWPT